MNDLSRLRISNCLSRQELRQDAFLENKVVLLRTSQQAFSRKMVKGAPVEGLWALITISCCSLWSSCHALADGNEPFYCHCRQIFKMFLFL